MFSPKRRILLTLLSIAPALLLSSCGKEAVLRVDEAVVKLSPVDTNPSAMYFTLHGGPSDVFLLSVTSRSVIRSEMHESGTDPKSGMMTMNKIDRVLVPAESKVAFRKGGKHVMLYGVNMPARRLQRIEAEYLFSNGDRILVEVPIEKIGADANEHAGH